MRERLRHVPQRDQRRWIDEHRPLVPTCNEATNGVYMGSTITLGPSTGALTRTVMVQRPTGQGEVKRCQTSLLRTCRGAWEEHLRGVM